MIKNQTLAFIMKHLPVVLGFQNIMGTLMANNFKINIWKNLEITD